MNGLESCAFWHMDGLGNDFVIVDLRAGGRMIAESARQLADRDGPLGCDQVITIENRNGPYMGIWNADGSPAEACGNAARCVAWLVAKESGQRAFTLGSPAGLLAVSIADDERITVDMGAPRLDWEDIPLAEEMNDTRYIDIKLGPIDNPVLWGPSAVSMGNPHCVFFVTDVETQALDRFGPMIEHHPLFPERANVTVAQVLDRTAIRARTWERGVGLTKACGTAACATLVSAVRRRLTERQATLHLEGGELDIHWRERDDHVLMTGPIRLNAQGTF